MTKSCATTWPNQYQVLSAARVLVIQLENTFQQQAIDGSLWVMLLSNSETIS